MQLHEMIDRVTWKMVEHDGGSPKRIQHFLKVHRFAQLIGREEQLDAHTQLVLECAALVHDIGIGPCKAKYGRCTGTLQEQEGPMYARALLEEFHLPEADVERICYLVAHHHSYDNIQGTDYQILVEADFLVNFHEDKMEKDTVRETMNRIFRTQTGKRLCQTMFGLGQ